MRDYGKIHTGFWSSSTLAGLDSDARLLAVYLLTSQHTTMSGAFRLPDAYACEDLGWDAERLRNGLQTLSEPSIGFIEYDPASKWIWVIKFLQFNRPDNPNQWKAVRKLLDAIPASVSFREKVFGTVSEPLGNPPVPAPVSVPAQKQAVELSDIAVPLDDGTDYVVPVAEIAEYRKAYPRLDVEAELRKSRAWCIANPTKRKTRRGAARFLNSWLSNATNDLPKPSAEAERAKLPGGGRKAL